MSSITFSFIINKQANFYYFLHNLARCEWPWPYRNSFLTEWEKMFGNLNKEEINSINNFKNIYNKYFLKEYLGESFFLHKNPWSNIERKLTKKEVNNLKEIFFVFSEKFENLFNYFYLVNWKERLNNYSKKREKYLFKKISKKIELFFDHPFSVNKVKVFLIFSKNKKIKKINAIGLGGERGRGLDGKSIFLEFSIISFNKTNYVAGVIWHEVCHSQFIGSPLSILINEKFKKNKKAASYVEEVIVRSLFPFGFLGNKFLLFPYPKTMNPSKEDSLFKINKKQTKEIIDLTKNHFDRFKRADQDYLNSIIKILKKDKKWANLLG